MKFNFKEHQEKLIWFMLMNLLFFIFYAPVFNESKHFSPSGQEYYLKADHLTRDYPVRFDTSDDLDYGFPINKVVHDRMRNGDFPLWNEKVALGKPILGDVTSVLFDPIRIISLIFKDFQVAWDFRIILTNYLGAIFCFSLIALIGGGYFSCFIASALFISSNFYSQDIVIGLTRSWLLISLFFQYQLLILKKKKYFFLMVAALSSMAFTGDLQMSMSAFAVTIVFFIFYAIEQFRKKRQEIAMMLFPLALLISLMISSVNILPALDVLSNSIRAMSFDFIKNDVTNFTDYLEWNTYYLGILWPFLLLSFLYKADVFKKSLLTSVVVVVVYSCSRDMVSIVSYIIPVFKNLQIANYYLITPYSAILPLIAGIGLNTLLSLTSNKKYLKLFIIFTITLSFGNSLWFSYKTSRDFFTSKENIYPSSGCIEDTYKLLNGFRLYNYNQNAKALPHNLPSYFNINTVKSYSILSKNYFNLLKTLDLKVRLLSPDDPFILISNQKKIINKKSFEMFAVKNIISYESIKSEKWNLVLENNSSKCFHRFPGYKIYEAQDSPEYVTEVKALELVDNDNSIIKKMSDINFNHETKTYISSNRNEFSFYKSKSLSTKSIISNFKNELDTISFNIETLEQKAILLKVSFDNGWKASIIDKGENKVLDIYRGNLNFIVLIVPAGKHRVELKYFPKPLYKSLILCFLGFLLLILCSFILCKKEIKEVNCPQE